jgi:hypothetical protein
MSDRERLERLRAHWKACGKPREYDADFLLHALDAAEERGAENAYEECETCGLTGTMTVVESDADGRVVFAQDVVCAECDGTGVGGFGRQLRRAEARGREQGIREALKAVEARIEREEYGYGEGHGSGNGDGSGYGCGFGNGFGSGSGNGNGYGDGSGHGSGNGSGDGYGSGFGDGDGYGSGYGDG